MARARFRLRYLLLVPTLTIATCLVGVWLAATCRPPWYQPRAIDYNLLPEDKRELARLGESIGTALHAGEGVELEIDEAQLNRWITARDELWPGRRVDLGPASDPWIDFTEEGYVRLAMTVRQPMLTSVISIAARPVPRDDHLILRITGARMGAIPAPTALIDRLKPMLESTSDGATLSEGGVLSLLNDFTWPNGDVRCRVATVEIDDLKMKLRLEPF
ncbi:MAG: hypothetical protein KDA32_03075 [Phycisphaerales bacterium]|nr:hypothetical protein [Phycisphaerales bacterium]